MFKPFLILQLRPEDETADSELRKICQYGGIAPAEFRRIRLEQQPDPKINLGDFAAIIVGGSPFDLSTPARRKSELQFAIEDFFSRLLDQVTSGDFPFLGCCSGNGLLGQHLGAEISGKYAEEVGAIDVEITEAGREDPLLAGLPPRFRVLVGHKEACDAVPPGSTLLAAGAFCQVQMFRVGSNVYATQFHPEGDYEGFGVRIEAYKHHGYFPPETAKELAARIRTEHTPEAQQILRRFVDRYRTPGPALKRQVRSSRHPAHEPPMRDASRAFPTGTAAWRAGASRLPPVKPAGYKATSRPSAAHHRIGPRRAGSRGSPRESAMPVRLLLPLALLFAQLFAQVAPATAAEARVAVAANFSAPAELLVEHFERAQTHRIELVFGSSARFYSQIRNGAPFDALLSADYEKPYLLAEQGLAAEDSLRAYATGRLVLWSAQSEVPITVDTLRAHGDGKIAMANPRLAPYGLAAREVIENLGLDEQLSENLILGENISQAFQFVATGNAPLGFVALSQVAKDGDIQRGSGWLVPTRLHAPIRQFAVLLNEENAAAAAFLQYLRGPAARRIIAEFGYSVDAGEG